MKTTVERYHCRLFGKSVLGQGHHDAAKDQENYRPSKLLKSKQINHSFIGVGAYSLYNDVIYSVLRLPVAVAVKYNLS